MHAQRKNDRKSPPQSPVCLGNWVHVNCLPGVPRASQIDAPLYHGTMYQRVTGMSLSPEGYESDRPAKARVCAVRAVYPHCCSLSRPGMRNCPCAASQQAVWEGRAVAVSLPAPRSRERRDPRGALHCSIPPPGLGIPPRPPEPQRRASTTALQHVEGIKAGFKCHAAL